MQDGVLVKGGGIRGRKGVERGIDFYSFSTRGEKGFWESLSIGQREEFTVHWGVAGGFGLGGLGYPLIS
jgi:hypothetical protein